jgi:hypothetical protein
MKRTIFTAILLGVLVVTSAYGQARQSINNNCSALGNAANVPVAWSAACRDGLADGLGIYSFTQPREQVKDTSRWHQKVLMLNGERNGVALGIRDSNMIGDLYVGSWPILRVSLFKDGGVFDGKTYDQLSATTLQTGLASARSLFAIAQSQNIPTQPWAEIEKTMRDWFANRSVSAEAFGAASAGRAPAGAASAADDPKVFGRSARGG